MEYIYVSLYYPTMENRTLSQIVAANIESLMNAQGYNGVTLAEKAGLSRTSVYAILKEDVASPRISTLERVAKALDVTVFELMADATEDEIKSEIEALVSAIPQEQRPRVRDMLLGIVRTLPA